MDTDDKNTDDKDTTREALRELLSWSKKLCDYSLEHLAINPIPRANDTTIDHLAEQIHVLWIDIKKADKKLNTFSELSRNMQKFNSPNQGIEFCLDIISDELRVSDACVLDLQGESYSPVETSIFEYLNEPIPKEWLEARFRKADGVVVLNDISQLDSTLCFSGKAEKLEQEGSHYMFTRISSGGEVLMFHRSAGSAAYSPFDIELVNGLCQFIALINDNNELYKDILQAKSELHRLNSTLVDLNVSLEKKVRERTLDLSKAKEYAEKAKSDAETANKTKSDFLAMMSHEIRTPMNGVLGMAQLLESTNLSQEQENYVKTIQNAGQLLLTLINDILDYSKIESGKMDIENKPFSLNECVRDLNFIFQNMAAQKGLTFEVNVDESIPKLLTGDRVRLEQVLINLCNNAIKFTNHGSVKLDVERLPETEWAMEKIYFSVTDTGIGISPEQLSKLFKPFSQADASTARLFGGTGLGLAIAKKLVNAMSGEIGVHSKQGKGSVFWFILPTTPLVDEGLIKAHADDALRQAAVLHDGTALRHGTVVGGKNGLETAHSQARQGIFLGAQFTTFQNSAKMPEISTRTKPSAKHILVVEDNQINQMTIKAMLGKEGHNCEFASTGEMAVTMYNDKPWDLIFMDCLLPGINGYQTTEKIRQMEVGKDDQVPIVALTANAMEEDQRKCIEVGMNDFISKPIKREILHTILEKHLTDEKQPQGGP